MPEEQKAPLTAEQAEVVAGQTIECVIIAGHDFGLSADQVAAIVADLQSMITPTYKAPFQRALEQVNESMQTALRREMRN